MIRLMWFVLKLGIIAAAAVWIAGLQGHVDIDFLEPGLSTNATPDRYTAKIDIRVFLFALLILFTIIFLIYEAARFFANMPKTIRRYNQTRRHEKGLQAVTIGLSSIAAGDAKSASYQARRAEKFLPSAHALPLLLKAQSARLKGDEIGARQNFEALLTHRDTNFLGLRGLLQSALDQGDTVRALTLAREAATFHPRQGWILKTIYELEIKMQDWDSALLTLYRAEKAAAISADRALSDRIAIVMTKGETDLQNNNLHGALVEFKKAFKYNPAFSPASVQLAKLYLQDGKNRAAIKVVEQAWTIEPHPDLVKMWSALQPPRKANDTLSRLNWHERLANFNPDHIETHIMLAQINMDQKFWGDARNHLKQAEEAGATDARTYHMRAELEDQTTRIDEFVMSWQDKAAEALPEKTWVCRETGRIYDRWHAIAQPHGSFNTIIWDHPHARIIGNAGFSALMNDTLLDAGTERPKPKTVRVF